jgi:hypothetical protein
MSAPRLGVMSFSLGADLWRRRLDVDGMISAIGSLGPGQELELIGSHALRGFPDPEPAEIDGLRSAMEEHGVVASVYCADVDRSRTTGTMLSPAGALELVEREAAIARRLGFEALRVSPAGPGLVEDLARLSERTGMVVLVEHGAEPRTDPPTAELLERIVALGTDRVGFIADGSAFVRRLPEPWKQACLDGGVPQEALDLVVGSWDPEVPLPDVMGRLHGLGLAPLELELSVYALMTTRFLFRKGDVGGLLDMLPVVHHVQTKYFATDATGADPCVPYDEIVPLLRDAGFAGGLHAEYEGGIWSAELDTMAELRRHQAYLTALWQDAPA